MGSSGFHYFQAPVENMSHFVPKGTCTFCDTVGPCLGLKDSKRGCLDCLRQGRFYFWHDTEIGLLTPDKGLVSETRSQKKLAREFKRVNFAALLKTPQFVTWQGERWLVHCDDFMIYLGEWEPVDFGKNAPDGDGRKLFMQMVEKELGDLWDRTIPQGATEPAAWHFQIHAFRCAHCGTLRGHWDCL